MHFSAKFWKKSLEKCRKYKKNPRGGRGLEVFGLVLVLFQVMQRRLRGGGRGLGAGGG